MWTYILQFIAGYPSLHQLPLSLERLYPVIIIILCIVIIALISLVIHVQKQKRNNSTKTKPKSSKISTESTVENEENCSSETATQNNLEIIEEIAPLERFALFVDSKNLYLSFKDMVVTENLEDFFKGKKFNVVAFLKDVIGGRNCVIKKYYRGYPIIPFGQETRASIKDKEDKEKFIKLMQKEGYDVPEGGVEVNIHGKQQEKGVDTLLTIGVLKGALENRYDTAIIVSSDRDFLPLIKEIKSLGKRFIYVTLDHNISKDMKRVASKTKVYTAEDMKKFIRDSTISSNGKAKD